MADAISVLTTVLTVSSVALVFGTVAVLLRFFWRTRNRGALLLAFALVFLPLLFVFPTKYVNDQVQHVMADEPAGWPFSMVAEGRATAGTLIHLFAVMKSTVVESCTLLGIVLLLRSKRPKERPSPEAAPALS